MKLQNKLNNKEIIALDRWITPRLDEIAAKPVTKDEVAARAQRELGFNITGANIAGNYTLNERQWPHSRGGGGKVASLRGEALRLLWSRQEWIFGRLRAGKDLKACYWEHEEQLQEVMKQLGFIQER